MTFNNATSIRTVREFNLRIYSGKKHGNPSLRSSENPENRINNLALIVRSTGSVLPIRVYEDAAFLVSKRWERCMKFFISCDMEGISGVTGSDDVDPKKEAYQRFRKIMTGDVNAAIEGALLAGAQEVLVNDSHNGMRNILIEELNPRAQLISGFTKPLAMMEGIDSSFGLAMYVGYHATAGTAAAVMNHTFFGRMVDDVWINNRLVGETAINAGIAGYFGVAVGAVSGDDKLAKEARSLLGNIETAVVKEGVDRYVAKCLSLNESRERIKNAAKRAVERRDEFKPLKYSSPVTFKIRFASTTEAATACLLPMLRMDDPRTVSFTQDDYLDAVRTYVAVLMLASTAQDETFG